MRLLETSKFHKLQKKLLDETEKEALKAAIIEIEKAPQVGKKLKGGFAELRSYGYSVRGQARRLIYRWEGDSLILYSFGPRQGIYK